MNLPHKLKEAITLPFSFIGPDQIAGYEFDHSVARIVLTRFPSGEIVTRLGSPGFGEMAHPEKGNYLLLLNAGDSPVGVYDLESNKVIMGYKSPAFALYDTIFAGETKGGEVGLYNISDKKLVAKVDLPDSPLGFPDALSFSTDGKWLAVSGPTRGAIWKLETGERLFHTRGFDGAFFDADQFIAEFPKHEKDVPRVFKFNLTNQSTENLYTLEPEKTPNSLSTEGKIDTSQLGDLLVSMVPKVDNKSFFDHVSMEVRDVRTNKKLWDRNLHKGRPRLFYSRPGNTLTVLIWDYQNILDEAKDDPGLNTRLNAIKGKEGQKASYVLRVLDGATGNNLGAVLVDTGNLSFKVRWAFAVRDTVLVGDSNDRTLVYSLKSGEQKGKIFGIPRAISNTGDRMLLENGKGDTDLYDTSTFQSLAHFTFPSRITYSQFSSDNSSIFVLTADQMVYNLKNPAATQDAAVH